MIFKEEQKGVKQLSLLEEGTKFVTISMRGSNDSADSITVAHIVARTVPGKQCLKKQCQKNDVYLKDLKFSNCSFGNNVCFESTHCAMGNDAGLH